MFFHLNIIILQACFREENNNMRAQYYVFVIIEKSHYKTMWTVDKWKTMGTTSLGADPRFLVRGGRENEAGVQG